MQNPSQDPPASLKAQNQDFRGTDCLCTFKNQDKEPKFRMWVYQRPVTIFKSRSGCQTPVREPQRPQKPQIRTLRKCILESYNLKIGLSEVKATLEVILATGKLY